MILNGVGWVGWVNEGKLGFELGKLARIGDEPAVAVFPFSYDEQRDYDRGVQHVQQKHQHCDGGVAV